MKKQRLIDSCAVQYFSHWLPDRTPEIVKDFVGYEKEAEP